MKLTNPDKILEQKKTIHSIRDFNGRIGDLLSKVNMISKIRVNDISIEYNHMGVKVQAKIINQILQIQEVVEVTERIFPKNPPAVYVAVFGNDLVLSLHFFEKDEVNALEY